jgi:beta-lactam-binding protein with PASTA domain
MAEVYKAQDEVLGRVDAVKVLLPQYATDPTFARRFRQEAQAAANLSSPYIVSIYDWGLDGETYYIVMEYVRGVDLKTAITQRGAIDQRKVAQIASQVCSGLAVAHDNDVIHRDIKPQNVMIQPDGNIKIMDFGVARAGNSTMTQTGSVLGTANYVSPEQAQGKVPGAASDLYSLGIMMYEAVTGRLPFEGSDAISVALKQVNEIPEPLSVHNPQISPDFEAIIMKALEKDPAKRFASADEMRGALNNFLNGKPVRIAGVTGMGAAATQVLPDGTKTKVLGPDASTTAVMPVSSYGQGGGKGGVKTPDKDKKKLSGKKRALIAIITVVAIAAIAAGVYFFMGGNSLAQVPNVVGETKESAKSIIEEAGFVVGTEKEEYSDTVEEGLVMRQSPKANSELAKGKTIDLVYSKGPKPPDQVKVPDLRNLTAEEAEKALSDKNLHGRAGDAVYDDEIEAGKVVKQDPAAGETVDEGSTITFYISLGPEPVTSVTVPSVIGDSESGAAWDLEQYGLYPDYYYVYSDTASAGVVIDQYPGAGAEVSPGSYIQVTVSQGPEPTPEPDEGGTDGSTDGSTDDSGNTDANNNNGNGNTNQ